MRVLVALLLLVSNLLSALIIPTINIGPNSKVSRNGWTGRIIKTETRENELIIFEGNPGKYRFKKQKPQNLSSKMEDGVNEYTLDHLKNDLKGYGLDHLARQLKKIKIKG